MISKTKKKVWNAFITLYANPKSDKKSKKEETKPKISSKTYNRKVGITKQYE